MNAHKFFNLVMALIFAFSLLGLPTPVLAQEPQLNPHIHAGPNQGFVYARDWPNGTLVHMIVARSGSTVYTSDATVGPCTGNPGSGPCGPNDAYFDLGYFDSGIPRFDLQPGDVITLTGGEITRSMIISLLVTGVNISNGTGTVTGVADPGRDVYIINGGISLVVTPDASGHWTANFAPNDLLSWDGWLSQVGENGNLTQQAWSAPEIWAHPNDSGEDWIEARDWSLGETVHLTIDNDTDPSNGTLYTDSGVVGPANYDSSVGVKEFHLGNFDLDPGQIITLTGATTTKVLVTTDINVTDMNPDLETISGTAVAGSAVQAWFSEEHTCDSEIYADENGLWTIDFKPCDIRPGVRGGVGQVDADNDSTVYFWQAPNPMLCINLTQDYQEDSIWSMGWLPKATVTLEVDNPKTIQYPDYFATQAGEWAWWAPPTTFAWFNLQGVFNIQPGYYVKMSDGTNIRTMVANLSVTSVNVSADTVSGTADPLSQVNVTAGDASRHIMADFAGRWIANFAHVGTQEDEQTTFDIVSDTTGVSDQWDEDGDCINFSWRVPSNQMPVAEAGPNQTAYEAHMVTLDASASSDPDGDALTYAWDFDNDGQYNATGVTTTTVFNQTGDHTIVLQATDSGGLSNTDTVKVTVLPWTLKGFYQPVDMNGVYNIVKSGSTVPLKFEIFAGSTELTDIAYIKSLTYVQTSCDANAITDEIETTAIGNTSLRYADGQFIYNWKTPNTAGRCYRLTMTTIDNSTLVAYFKLK